MRRAHLTIALVAFIAVQLSAQAPSGKFFIIYAVGSENGPEPLPLPEWWARIWNINEFPSFPGYVKEVTRNNIIYDCVPLGTEGETGGYCIYINDVISPNGFSTYDEFGRRAVEEVCNVYDFRPYIDVNNTVHGSVLIPTPYITGHGSPGGFGYGWVYTTNQQLASGQYVKMHIHFTDHVAPDYPAVALAAHEWGHNVGLPDIGYPDQQDIPSYTLGGYEVMNSGNGCMGFWNVGMMIDRVPSHINPKWRIEKGWLQPIDIYQSVTDFHVEDISSGKVYRVFTGDRNQYFMLSNHQKNNRYEQNWLNTGLLIWHINDSRNMLHQYAPEIDIECAYGLWDWHFGSQPGDTFPVSPNPISGFDSLDIFGIYDWVNDNKGNASDFYPGAINNTCFTPSSNPSSNLYNKYEVNFPENIYSGVKILNIRKDPSSSDMIVDIDMSEVPPTPSQGLTVVLSEWPYRMQLHWGANQEPDVVGYEVWREHKLFDGTLIRKQLVYTQELSYQDADINSGKTYKYYILAVDADGNRSNFENKVELSVPQYITNQFATMGNSSRKLSLVPGMPEHFALCYEDMGEVNMLFSDTSMSIPQYFTFDQGKNPTISVSGNKGTFPVIMNIATEYNYINPLSLYGTAVIKGYKQPWAGGVVVYPYETTVIDGGEFNRVLHYASMASPSLVQDKNGDNHLVWESYFASRVIEGWLWTYSVKYGKYDANWNPLQDIETIHSESWIRYVPEPEPRDTLLPRSACISVDLLNNPHVVWSRNDEIYYSCRQNESWTPIVNLSNDPNNRHAKEPFIETYFNAITTAWVEDFGGFGDIHTKYRFINDNYDFWRSYRNISNTQSLDSRYPQIMGRDYFVYNEKNSSGKGEVLLKRKTDNEIWNISNSSNVYSDCQQNIYTYFDNGEYRIWFPFTAWLEGDQAPYQIKSLPNIIAETPFNGDYFVPVADTMPSPYTVSRDGFTVYPSGIGVDYDSSALVYEIPVYDTVADYDLFVVGYHESSGVWRQMVEVDGKWMHQMKYTANSPETLRFRVPPAFKKDGIIEIAIKRKDGDYAAIANLGLFVSYSDTASGGGAQSASNYGIEKPTEIFLMQNAPNPVATTTSIRFQLPVDGLVGLRIYNVAGQLVKTLVNEYSAAGSYTVTWDGKDESGKRVSSGVYLYRLDSGKSQQIKRLTMIR